MIRCSSSLLSELRQVDVRVQRAALLEVLHPFEDLVHVPGGHEEKVVEEAHEVLEGLQDSAASGPTPSIPSASAVPPS
jgi:hypothetical protein